VPPNRPTLDHIKIDLKPSFGSKRRSQKPITSRERSQVKLKKPIKETKENEEEEMEKSMISSRYRSLPSNKE